MNPVRSAYNMHTVAHNLISAEKGIGGGGMGAHAAAAIGRSRALRGALAASPSIDPSAADSGTGQAGGGPEIDCVSALLASNVIDDAERRAAALGIGADRGLITLLAN